MVGNFVEDSIIDLDKNGKKDEALDVIYDIVYDLIKEKRFVKIDNMLRYMRPIMDTYSLTLAIGILTATLLAKDKLCARKDYLDAAIAKSLISGHYTDTLFKGLY
jgi:hypothetical protein